ncbi:hypothetical protein D3C86_1484830 [compost metagenome]
MGKAIRRIGEGCGSLVGGDNEIRIVAIEPQCVGRRHDGVLNDIVGDGQQGADIGLIGLAAGIEDLVAGAAGGQALREEAALGANGNDHCVLDLLRLDETEHFRAVILAPIRPAQTATCDVAEAQMHTFDLGSVNEDFAEGAGVGQAIKMFGIELERQNVTRRAIGILLEVVGAQRCVDGVDVTSEGAVLIEIGNAAQCRFDCLVYLGEFLHPLLFLNRRIEAGLEQRENIPRNVRIFIERFGNMLL